MHATLLLPLCYALLLGPTQSPGTSVAEARPFLPLLDRLIDRDGSRKEETGPGRERHGLVTDALGFLPGPAQILGVREDPDEREQELRYIEEKRERSSRHRRTAPRVDDHADGRRARDRRERRRPSLHTDDDRYAYTRRHEEKLRQEEDEDSLVSGLHELPRNPVGWTKKKRHALLGMAAGTAVGLPITLLGAGVLTPMGSVAVAGAAGLIVSNHVTKASHNLDEGRPILGRVIDDPEDVVLFVDENYKQDLALAGVGAAGGLAGGAVGGAVGNAALGKFGSSALSTGLELGSGTATSFGVRTVATKFAK